MAKSKNCYLLILCFLAFTSVFGQHSINADSLREAITKTYLAEVGTKEATGQNDGIRIEQYIGSTELNPKGKYPWCAAFVYWVYLQNGIVLPVAHPAWTPDYFYEESIIWEAKGRYNLDPKKGDVIGIYFPNLGRIAHVGFFYQEIGDYFITVEGNTNAQGSRDGDQVAIRKRRKIQIRYVARFIQ